MTKLFRWALPAIFLISCNNAEDIDKRKNEKTTGEHAGHALEANNNYCDSVNSGLIEEDTLKGSPLRTAMSTINGTHVHINYSSPGVKGRIVWGGLVGYDKVWVAGAHRATNVQFNRDVEINGKKIAAGKYAFFIIPGKEKWTVILNARSDQHLADEYNVTEDIVRSEVKPGENVMTPRLTYSVNKINDNSGEIVMQWEKIIVRTPFRTL
jgi:hypothetical protein